MLNAPSENDSFEQTKVAEITAVYMRQDDLSKISEHVKSELTPNSQSSPGFRQTRGPFDRSMGFPNYVNDAE